MHTGSTCLHSALHRSCLLCNLEPREGRVEEVWAEPAKKQCSRAAWVSGMKLQARLKGSRRLSQGFPVSGQVEGSQYAGITDIWSWKSSFMAQLFCILIHEQIVLSQAPVLIWPVNSSPTILAMNVSSISPKWWLTMTLSHSPGLARTLGWLWWSDWSA